MDQNMFLMTSHRLSTTNHKKSSFWETTGFKNHATTEAVARLHAKRSCCGQPVDASVKISNPVSAMINLISLNHLGAFQAYPIPEGIFLTTHSTRRAKQTARALVRIRYTAPETAPPYSIFAFDPKADMWQKVRPELHLRPPPTAGVK